MNARGRGRGGGGRGRGAWNKPISFVGGETQKWQDTLGVNQQGYDQSQPGYDQTQPAYQTQQGYTQNQAGYNQSQGFNQNQQGYNQGYDQQGYNQSYAQDASNTGTGWQTSPSAAYTPQPAGPRVQRKPPPPPATKTVKKFYGDTSRVEKLLDGKNAAAALNEAYKVPQTSFHYQPVMYQNMPSKVEYFLCTITHDGGTYEGQGTNKKEAKANASLQMLEKTGWTPDKKAAAGEPATEKNYQRLMHIYGVQMLVETSEEGPPFRVSITLPFIEKPFVGVGPSKTKARAEVAGAICKAIDADEIKTPEPAKTTTFDPEQNELMNKFYNWVYECGTVAEWDVDYDGPPYLASVKFPECENVFKDYGVNRRTAKYNVARMVLEALKEGKFGPPPRQKETYQQPIIGITSPEESMKKLNELFRPGEIEWTYTQYGLPGQHQHVANASIQEQTFSASAQTKKAARQQVAVDILQAVNELRVSITKSRSLKRKASTDDYVEGMDPPKLRRKDGVSIVLETYGNTLKFTYNTFGTGSSAYSTCAVELKGRVFEAKGSNKKTARHLVANMILDAIDIGQIVPPKTVNMYVDESKIKTTQVTAMKPPKEKLVEQTSPVTVFDMFGRLDFDYEETESDQMHATVHIKDQIFTGLGETACAARKDVCDKIITAVQEEKLEPPELADTMTATDKEFSAKCITMFRDHVMWNFDLNDREMITARSWYQGMDFIDTGSTRNEAMFKVWREMLKAYEEKKITIPDSKNSLALMNELFSVENRVVQIDSTGPVHAPAFTATYTVKGLEFTGVSGSKKEARLKAAEEVVKAVESGKLTPDHLFNPTLPREIRPKPQKKERGETYEMENPPQKVHRLFTKDVVYAYEELSITPHLFKCVATLFEKTFTGEGQNKKEARFAACNAIIEALDKGEIKSSRDREYTSGVSLKVQCEKAGSTLEHKDLDTIVNGKQRIFRIAAIVDGQEFIGSGLSQRKAKANANSLALSEKFDIHVRDLASEELKLNPDFEAGDVGAMNPNTLSNTVQRLVQEHYSLAVTPLEYNFKQRKVLAGCVQTVDDDVTTAKIITVTAGTKCIDGSMLSTQGISLNDMHAEILVKRVMKLYFMEQLENLTKKQESIFLMPADKRKKTPQLKPGVRFHLYISSPPCGDSRLFSMSDENQQPSDPNNFIDDEKLVDKNPNRQNRGLLRVKCEAGEGTIPVNSENITQLQTYDGVVAGERLQIMSCSDKVARSTILGIQGALLSRLIAPIYYSSITIGSLYNPQHLYRGLYGRFSGVKDELSGGFWAQPPAILGVYSEELRNKAKAPSHAVVVYGELMEVIKTVNGKLQENNQPSQLSKRELFLKFREVFNLVKKTDCEEVYSQAKSSATAYQNNKKALTEYTVKSGIGAWNKVPPELDQFNKNAVVTSEPPKTGGVRMDTC